MNKTLVVACAAAAAVIVGGGVGAWALLSDSGSAPEPGSQAASAASAVAVDPQRPRPVPVVKKLDVKAVEWDPQTKADLAAQGFTFDEVGRPVAPSAQRQGAASDQPEQPR